ncbi:hypothetical protein TARUN_3639 [Trichoderma arundinaceum]|uniref:Mitochondrial zinc maintenance protein 1, mitochondrial n=1 Tax=Trichoderma arundinaceum TaxID=490622 RepID=A0A395NR97_TRIAR|nr:hypothetical protein TARUN_3639 [Trichoderma arundinaceum]
MSLAAYRHLMRAARIAFQGDVHVLSAAQNQIRQTFQENRALDSSSSIQTAIRHAEDVATILRENVVQGQKIESDGSNHTYSEICRQKEFVRSLPWQADITQQSCEYTSTPSEATMTAY